MWDAKLERGRLNKAVFAKNYTDFMQIKRYSHGYLIRSLYSTESLALSRAIGVLRTLLLILGP